MLLNSTSKQDEEKVRRFVNERHPELSRRSAPTTLKSWGPVLAIAGFSLSACCRGVSSPSLWAVLLFCDALAPTKARFFRGGDEGGANVSNTAEDGLGPRLRRLPGQVLVALVNGTAVLIIAAAILTLMVFSRAERFAGNIAATMTDAVLARVDVDPQQALANLQGSPPKSARLGWR